MPEFEVSHDFKHPAERVWAVISDPTRWQAAVPGIERAEIVEGGGGVGTVVKETRVFMNREATEHLRLAEVGPGHRLVITADSHGTHYHTTQEIEPIAGGCRVTTRTRAKPQRFAAKVMSPVVGVLMKKSMCRFLKQDLAGIDDHLRRGGSGMEPGGGATS